MLYEVITGDRVGILEVDFMLPFGDLVMGRFDLKAHFFQGFDNGAAAFDPAVIGFNIKITGDVVGDGGGTTFFVPAEEEELALGADVHGVTEFFGFFHNPLQVATGAAIKGGSVRFVNIADDTGGVAAVLFAPGENDKGVIIRFEVHIGFVDANKTFNGRTVEHDLAIQGFFNLTAWIV